jgi:hypothetical protein
VRPSELSLFSDKEQVILLATERPRMSKMSEDEISELLTLVRRSRDKYSTLHRRQSSSSITATKMRSAASSSNVRTLRKAEIFEDALARVSASLASAARASRDELKKQRLAASRGLKMSPASKKSSKSSRTATNARPVSRARSTQGSASTEGKGQVTKRRMSDTRATNARVQAKRDRSRK